MCMQGLHLGYLSKPDLANHHTTSYNSSFQSLASSSSSWMYHPNSWPIQQAMAWRSLCSLLSQLSPSPSLLSSSFWSWQPRLGQSPCDAPVCQRWCTSDQWSEEFLQKKRSPKLHRMMDWPATEVGNSPTTNNDAETSCPASVKRWSLPHAPLRWVI